MTIFQAVQPLMQGKETPCPQTEWRELIRKVNDPHKIQLKIISSKNSHINFKIIIDI